MTLWELFCAFENKDEGKKWRVYDAKTHRKLVGDYANEDLGNQVLDDSLVISYQVFDTDIKVWVRYGGK